MPDNTDRITQRLVPGTNQGATQDTIAQRTIIGTIRGTDDHILTLVATNDLIAELLTRYHEVVIIGHTPTDNITLNQPPNHTIQDSVVDVYTRLKPHTDMAGTLRSILMTLLHRLSPAST